MPDYIWQRLLEYEVTTVPNVFENSLTWEMIKGESCKGTRKLERQKFNMSKGQIDGGKNDSNTNENNNATECGETTSCNFFNIL